MVLNFINPIGNSTYKIYDLLRIKLSTGLRLSFSHPSENKFRHKLADSLNPLCSVLFKLSLHFIFFSAAKILQLYAKPL